MKIRSFLMAGALVAMSGGVVMAQSESNTGIGIHFGGYDFYGPQGKEYFRAEINKYEFNNQTERYDTSTTNRIVWNPLVKLSWWRELNSAFTLGISGSFASLEYPESRPDSNYIRKIRNNTAGDRNDRFLGELDFRFNYNILPRKEFIVSPYVFAGLNASYHDIYFGADIPLGLGFNIALDKAHDLSLNLESAYKIAATDHDVNHLQHTIGVIYWFKPGYKAPDTGSPDTAVVNLRDSDNDGIEDTEDQCPTVAGMAQFNGCPDTDGDGISDKDDACPLVAGLAQYNGCPDTDADGIPDNNDKCPYVAGPGTADGCPAVGDRDKDGFTDDVDRCPDQYSKTNQGCPEIRSDVIMQMDKAAKAIFFETGQTTVKTVSYNSLNTVVSILKADPTLYADIEGHTDNVAPKSFTNMELSQKRADAVRDYLISKGISGDRLTATGYGDTQPIADNTTPAGRAQNRRTVIKLRNYRK